MSIDAVLVKIRQVDGRDLEVWCRRITKLWKTANGTFREDLYAYADVTSGHHYPPHRCIEIREGRVDVRAVEAEE